MVPTVKRATGELDDGSLRGRIMGVAGRMVALVALADWLPNTPGRSIAPGAPEANDIHNSFLHTA